MNNLQSYLLLHIGLRANKSIVIDSYKPITCKYSPLSSLSIVVVRELDDWVIDCLHVQDSLVRPNNPFCPRDLMSHVTSFVVPKLREIGKRPLLHR